MSLGRLVLTRKQGQCVKVGETGMVKVLEVHPAKAYVSVNGKSFMLRLGDSVDSLDSTFNVEVGGINRGILKLVFTADRSINIVRTEIINEQADRG